MRNGAKQHHHPHTRLPHANGTHHPPHAHGPQSNGVRNGGPHPKLGALPKGGSSTSSSSSAGPRHSKKLQSNPSITSQSSKRSKSSSKSNSSQIPTEAQDGEEGGGEGRVAARYQYITGKVLRYKWDFRHRIGHIYY